MSLLPSTATWSAGLGSIFCQALGTPESSYGLGSCPSFSPTSTPSSLVQEPLRNKEHRPQPAEVQGHPGPHCHTPQLRAGHSTPAPYTQTSCQLAVFYFALSSLTLTIMGIWSYTNDT